MTKDTQPKMKKRPKAEQVSTGVHYALVAFTVVVFGAFFMIGYDIPYDENPEFNAPLFTDLVLGVIYSLVVVTVVLVAVAVVAGLRRGGKSESVVNNIPVSKIAWGTAVLLAGSMVVTFAFGSADPVTVNGVAYEDVFWLKATDMFINTSFVLLFVAVCGVAFGVSGYSRKLKYKHKA